MFTDADYVQRYVRDMQYIMQGNERRCSDKNKVKFVNINQARKSKKLQNKNINRNKTNNIYLPTYKCICMYTYVRLYTYICTHTSVHICVYLHVCIYVACEYDGLCIHMDICLSLSFSFSNSFSLCLSISDHHRFLHLSISVCLSTYLLHTGISPVPSY